VGSLALPAAYRVGQSGEVLALEPTPRVAALLRQSAALNGVSGWLRVQECAAGETQGVATLNVSAQVTHNSLLPLDEAADKIQVAVRPLDTLVRPGGRVDVVKIDVEGTELQVWRGMRRIVADNPKLAVILEFGSSHLRRAGTTVAAWFAEFRKSGFSAWEIDEATGFVRPLRETGLDDVLSLNLLLLRDSPTSRGLREA
jgi:FkbM family methyltransferase